MEFKLRGKQCGSHRGFVQDEQAQAQCFTFTFSPLPNSQSVINSQRYKTEFSQR
jgi:hypothetical protein